MAEGARLESVYTGNRIVGSNPTLSAIKLFILLCFHVFLIDLGLIPTFVPIGLSSLKTGLQVKDV